MVPKGIRILSSPQDLHPEEGQAVLGGWCKKIQQQPARYMQLFTRYKKIATSHRPLIKEWVCF